MISGLAPRGEDDGLDGNYCSHTRPMLSAMVVMEQVGVPMMKEYFKIEASSLVMKSIRLPRMDSRSTYLEENVLTCYLERTLRGISESKYYGISCFSRENET